MFQQTRKFLGTIAAAFATLAIYLVSQSALAQGLVYVDASHINPINLTPFTAIDDGLALPAETWESRQDFGSASQPNAVDGIGVFEAPNGDSSVTGAPEMTFTFSSSVGQVLPAGNWDIYTAYWTDNDENWTISTGLTSGNLTRYSFTGESGRYPDTVLSTNKGLPAGLAQWTTLPPVTVAGTTLYDRPGSDPLTMLLAYAGTVNADGVSDVSVFIDDLPGQGVGRRSWFDGVAYAPAGTGINTLNATINRATGELILSNPTNVNYNIKSISIESISGALNPMLWDPITGTLDNGGGFDSDGWVINVPTDPPATVSYSTTLTEVESVLGDGTGGVLTAAGGSLSSINFGDVWRPVPFDIVTRLGEDVVLLLTLGDGTQVNIAPNFTGTPIPLGSFDEDTDLDTDDFQILLDNMNSSLWAMATIAERYQNGDLTGDRVVNYYDLAKFRTLFDDFNGEGAFNAMVGGAQVPEPSSLVILLGSFALALAFFQRRLQKNCGFSIALMGLLFCAPQISSAIDIKVDIDSMRTSSSAAATPFTTQAGFTSWDLTNVPQNTSSTPLVVEGVTMEIFGISGGVNQSRIRTTGGGGPYNDLLADFVYNEGANNRAFGLRLTGLSAGIYHMYSWHYDGINATDATQVEVRDQGVAGSTKIVTNGLWSANPIPVVFEVGTPAKEFVYREFSTANRVRLNGFTIQDFSGLTLEVTSNTGAMRILNEQGTEIDLSYYEIHSASGQLTGSWDSIESTESDPLGMGWDELTNTSPNFLSEVRLEGVSTLAATGMSGDFISLGSPFALNGTQDIYFTYGSPDDEFLRAGYVKYITAITEITGDYNDDDIVNAADYAVWRDNVGGTADLNGDLIGGTIDGDQWTQWKENFGDTTGSGTGATAIPEPASAMLLILAAIGLLAGTRRSV